MGKSAKGKLSPLSAAAAATLARVELTKKTPEEWLEWALEATETAPPKDEQAWTMLRWQVQGFSQEGGLAHVAVERDQPPAVSKSEARVIVQRLDSVITQMVDHRPSVVLGHFRMRREAVWSPEAARYELTTVPLGGAGREAHALQRFAELVTEFSYGLSKCPADAPRVRTSAGKWKAKGKCGRRFLVRRPGQRFCSPRCQTRMKVRGLRAQQGKKISKPGKAKKKGKHAAA